LRGGGHVGAAVHGGALRIHLAKQVGPRGLVLCVLVRAVLTGVVRGTFLSLFIQCRCLLRCRLRVCLPIKRCGLRGRFCIGGAVGHFFRKSRNRGRCILALGCRFRSLFQLLTCLANGFAVCVDQRSFVAGILARIKGLAENGIAFLLHGLVDIGLALLRLAAGQCIGLLFLFRAGPCLADARLQRGFKGVVQRLLRSGL